MFIIGRADRFQCGKQIASYLGLLPLEDSSGNGRRLGHITKQGSSMLRFLMVEASQVTVRSLPEWRSKYFHLMMRRGRKIAEFFGWVLLLKFHQVLAQGLVHLRPSANCSRGIRLPLLALASTKLPSTDRLSPCTSPTPDCMPRSLETVARTASTPGTFRADSSRAWSDAGSPDRSPGR